MRRAVYFCTVQLATLLAVCLSGGGARAQQALKDSRSGEVLGWHFSLHRGAPRVVILPETNDDREERMALALSLIHI